MFENENQTRNSFFVDELSFRKNSNSQTNFLMLKFYLKSNSIQYHTLYWFNCISGNYRLSQAIHNRKMNLSRERPFNMKKYYSKELFEIPI